MGHTYMSQRYTVAKQTVSLSPVVTKHDTERRILICNLRCEHQALGGIEV